MISNNNVDKAAKSLVPVQSPAISLPPSRHRKDMSGQSSPGITPQFVLYVLLRWWKIATPLGLLLAVVAAGCIFWMFEPTYEASNLFQIKSRTPFLAYKNVSGQAGYDRFVQTQVGLVLDPLVLASVATKFTDLPELKEAKAPVQWLTENVKFKPLKGSELYSISVTTSDQETSHKIANAVFEAYYLLLGQEDLRSSQDVISTLLKEKVEREEEVKRLQNRVRELAKQATGTDPFMAAGTASPTLDYPLAGLHGRLVTTEVEQEVLIAKIAALEKKLAEEPVDAPAVLIEEAVDQDPRVLQLQAQIDSNELTLEEMKLRLVSPTEDYRYKDLQGIVIEEQQLLETIRDNVRERIGAKVTLSQTSRHEEVLAAMRTDLESHQITEKLLRKRYEEKLKDAGIAGGDTVELRFAERELAEAQGVFNTLSDRILQLTTEQDAPDQVKWWRDAERALAPVEAMPFKKMALASSIFFLPFLLAGGWEFFVRRVNNTKQLEDAARLPVVAEVARIPVWSRVARNGSKDRVDRGLTVFEESIDSLRTQVMLSDAFKGMQVLAMTSASAEAGKTSVAAQLAVNIAWVSGKKTLLIDGDLRSPDLHTIFDISLEVGLADVLAGKCSVEDAIVRVENIYTDVLPAGKLSTNPHRLFGNGALRSLLDEVRSKYDYIIIDTPPVLAASEAIVLAKMADRSLMCVMQDSSRIDQVIKANEQMRMAGVEPVGIVLNGVPTFQYAYRYGAYAYSSR